MNGRRAPLLAALVALLLTAVAWFLVFQPNREERAALVEETARLEGQQQQLRLEIARLEEIRANEPQIRAALARAEEFLPSGVAQPSTLRQFQLTADAAGVVVTSVSFGGPEPLPDAPATRAPGTVLARIPLTMVFEGGYFQATDFFRRVEVAVPRAVLVRSVSVVESQIGFPLLQVTWSGDLFAVVPVATANQPAPPPEDDAEPEEAA